RQVDTRFEQFLRELARAVRAEVEKNGAVTGGIEPWTVRDHDWFDELIRDSLLITTPNGVDRILGLRADTADDRVDRAVRPVPALVPVHRVVAPGNGRDAVGRKLGEIAERGMG